MNSREAFPSASAMLSLIARSASESLPVARRTRATFLRIVAVSGGLRNSRAISSACANAREAASHRLSSNNAMPRPLRIDTARPGSA